MFPSALLILSSIIFSGVGIAIFVIAFWLIDKATPHDLWREIIEKQNMALAVLAGSAVIGVAIIIASAIHG